MNDHDETEIWTLSEEDVALYFRAKIQEARELNEEKWLDVLLKSQILWQEDKRITRKLGQDMVRWVEEVRLLNDLLYQEQAEEPRLQHGGLNTARARARGARLGPLSAVAIGIYTSVQAVSGDIEGLCAGLLAYGVLLLIYVNKMRREEND